MRPRHVLVSSIVAGLMLAPPVAAREVGDRAYEQLPNLVPLPAFDLAVPEEGRPDAPFELRFAVATANRGDFDLDLRFESSGGGTDEAGAHQCVVWLTDRVCSQREEVGTFEWHPEHGHHHFEDFALYELRRFKRKSRPDMSPKGLVATSGKISFCLMDVEQDDGGGGPLYSMPYPLYLTCLVGAGSQGISRGWRDVYSAGTEGQAFDLSEVRDGKYALVLTSDPAGRLFESDETDNVSVTGFRLSRAFARVDVFCTSAPGSRRCDPVEPGS